MIRVSKIFKLMTLIREWPLLISLRFNRSLNTLGWFRAYRKKSPVDGNGNPIPWYTYSFIKFLETRLKKDFVVFEYGSGFSTLWYAGKVKKVISIEHNHEWYTTLLKRLPDNATVFYRELVYGGDYSSFIKKTDSLYDIIVIDGRDRINATKHSVKKLKEKGVVIFDNSNREKYEEAYAYLTDQGFNRLDFWGVGAVTFSIWCTSVFYKKDNVLGI